MPLTRDEIIEQYGVDPDAEDGIEKLNAAHAPSSGGVVDHLKSAVVGAASIPTDFINLFPTVTGAAAAGIRSYMNDTKFVDEFAKQQQIPEGAANTQQHFRDIAAAWKQQNPALTETDILAGLADYQKTKEYEDFKTSQLGGTHWLAAKTKDTIRGALGDERPDSERSWTEGAAEAIGGALIPGPTGWANATRAAVTGVPVVGRAANSLIGRGTLRTAEIFTPLTMPYTKSNVVLNAAAGIGIDQGMRALQDKPTAFSPGEPDPSQAVGVASMVGVAGAALGAVVAAVKGRTHALQGAQLADAAAALRQQNMQPLNQQIANPGVPGQAGMVSGPNERQLDPPAYSDKVGIFTRLKRHFETQAVDEGASTVDTVRDTVYRDTGDLDYARHMANITEQMISENMTAVNTDRARANINAARAPIDMAFDAMPGGANGENARGVRAGMQAASQVAKWGIKHDQLLDAVNDARAKSVNPTLTQKQRDAWIKELAKRRADFQRHAQDVPSARSALPDTDMARLRVLANNFTTDQRPFVVAVKNAVRKYNDDLAQKMYNSGRISQETLTRWRTRDPYHVSLMDDPLQGLTGFRRMWRSWNEARKATYTQSHSNAAAAVGHEGAINSLDRTVRSGKGPGETRISRPLDVDTAQRLYGLHVENDVMMTTARNSILDKLTVDQVYGGPSALVRNGHIREVKPPRQRTPWFGAEKIDSDKFVQQALLKEDVAIQWDGGRFRLWQLGDKELARVLRHQPHQMHGAVRFMGEMARWFKHFTTGFGAPWFAPKAAAYNLTVGAVTKAANRAFGTLDMLGRHVLPEKFANATLGRIYDPTVIASAPYHFARLITDMLADFGAKWMGSRLAAESGAFGALKSAMGAQRYQKLMDTVVRIGQRVHEGHSMHLVNSGLAADNGLHAGARQATQVYDMAIQQIPSWMRTIYGVYKSGINAVYLTPQRILYAQNYGLLHRKYGGNVPQWEIDKLTYEARHLGGDMTKVAGSKLMRDAEAMTPYLTQTKLGTYHLLRNMGSPETFHVVLPRLVQMMGLMGTGMWWRTTWNEESAYDYWHRLTDTERLRFIDVPHPNIFIKGWDATPFSRDMFWRFPIAPDFAGIIAATGALMQAFGALPSGVTPKPLSAGVWPVFIDSVTPGMPTAFQALLAAGGAKLDPQTADTRGGNIIRTFNANFRKGPQAEAASNLGQASNTTHLLMNAFMGAMGSHLAQSIEVLLHASKYDGSIGPGNVHTERQSRDFGAGLNAAVNTMFQQATRNIPDIPLLWKGESKYSVMTASWKFVRENDNYMDSIKGMRDTALGKSSMERRARDVAIGGVPVQPVTDAVLLSAANDVAEFTKPTGPLGQLAKQYADYGKDARGFRAQYRMTPDMQRQAVNANVKAQQDNVKQQQLAIEWMEQKLAQKYGAALAPRLAGREFSIKTLEAMMREQQGGATPEQAVAQ